MKPPGSLAPAVAAAVALFVSASLLTWAALDERPLPVGDAYVEKTLNLADDFVGRSWLELPRAIYWSSIGPRPPLYQALSAVAVLALGRSPDAMLVVNAAFLALLAGAVYSAGRFFVGSWASVLAAALALTYPLQLHIARHARPHAVLPAIVAIFLWMAMRFRSRPSAASAWAVVMSLGLLFAMHPNGFLLALGPFVLLLAEWSAGGVAKGGFANSPRALGRRLRSPEMVRGFLPAGVLLGLLAGTWTGMKWTQYVSMRQLAAGQFAPYYSFWYVEEQLPTVLSPPLFAAFVLALLVVAVRIVRRPAAERDLAFVTLSLAAMFVTPHLVAGAKTWLSFAGILPAIALVTAGGLDRRGVPSESRAAAPALRFGRPVVVGLVLVACAANYSTQLWGVPSGPAAERWLGIDPECTRLDESCPDAPRHGEWPIADILRVVVDDPGCADAGCRVALVSHRQEDFSDEAFAYTLVQRFPAASRSARSGFYPVRTVRIDRLGGGPGGSVGWLAAEYVVYLLPAEEGPARPRGPSRLELAVVDYLARVAEPAGRYRRRLEARLPTGELAVLAERSGPFSPEEAGAVIASLDLAPDESATLLADLANGGLRAPEPETSPP